MFALIVQLIMLGLVVWLAVTYIPMPEVFRRIIYIIAAVCLIALLIQAFGIRDIPVPQVQ